MDKVTAGQRCQDNLPLNLQELNDDVLLERFGRERISSRPVTVA